VILVDTSVIVAWMDTGHEHHKACTDALFEAVGRDQCAVSTVTYAELAVGGRTREAVEEELAGFSTVELTVEDAWRAGVAFGAFPKRKEAAVLPDFFIRAQAATRGWQHLTNDDKRLTPWHDVDFLFVRPRKG